jgi:hypothetical protein
MVSKSKIEGIATFLMSFGAHMIMNVLFIIQVKIHVFIEWSCILTSKTKSINKTSNFGKSYLDESFFFK